MKHLVVEFVLSNVMNEPYPYTSIVIRTRDEEEFLERTLEAVFNQRFKNFEVIIIDSGSRDLTLSIASAYKTRIVEIPPQSFTYGHASNIGASVAKGRILVSLSGHSVPASRDWLSNLIHPFQDDRVAAVSSKHISHSGHFLEITRWLLQSAYSFKIRNQIIRRFLFHNASAAIRKNLWETAAYNEMIDACEDHLWALEAEKMDFLILHEPNSVVFHSHKESFLKAARRRLRAFRALSSIYQSWYFTRLMRGIRGT